MFIGEYKHSIDPKGRVAVPARFRALLKSGAVVTRGLDNCLFLYPKEAWNEMAQKWAKLPVNQANSRAFARLMLAGAMEVAFDNQGRIMLPKYLRTFAGLKKSVVVAGLFDRLELWDEEKWNTYKNSAEINSSDIAEAIGEF